jgi:hypothetical protein
MMDSHDGRQARSSCREDWCRSGVWLEEIQLPLYRFGGILGLMESGVTAGVVLSPTGRKQLLN